MRFQVLSFERETTELASRLRQSDFKYCTKSAFCVVLTTKREFLRPNAATRSARSLALLSRGRRASLTKWPSAVHWASA